MKRNPLKTKLDWMNFSGDMLLKWLNASKENRDLVKEIERLRKETMQKASTVDASLIVAPDLSKGWRIPK